MEHGITFDGVIGVSAGAVHGCSYLSGQHGRSIRYYKKYSRDPRFMSIWSLLKTGNIVGVDFCYHELPEKLDLYDNEAFLRCGVPFYAVCSNVETGEAEYLQVHDMLKDIDVVRASASMPFVSKVVEVNGKKYLDGGSTDSIPVEAFMQMGYGRNVVVLTRDEAYRKKKELSFLSRVMYRKYPAFAKVQGKRHEVYNQTVERICDLEKEGSAFVIRPSRPLKIKRTENRPEKIEEIYLIGRSDALAKIEDLKAWRAENT